MIHLNFHHLNLIPINDSKNDFTKQKKTNMMILFDIEKTLRLNLTKLLLEICIES